MTLALGIDLGTCNNKVATLGAHGPEPLLDEDTAQPFFPNAQCHASSGIIHGQEAVNSRLADPKAYVERYKLRIGDDDFVFEAPDGRKYSAEDLARESLRHLLSRVEKRTGQRPASVVLTVPSNSAHPFRQGLTDACKSLGVDVLQLVNEPTAAAIAYVNQQTSGSYPRHIAVFDLGGGTFDATLIKVTGPDGVEVEGSSGIPDLGGQDLTFIIFQLCLDAVDAQFGACPDPATTDPEEQVFLTDLFARSEAMKRTLNTRDEATVALSLKGKPFVHKIRREDFEKAARPLAQQAVDCTTELLQKAGRTLQDTEIILVGGGCNARVVEEALAAAAGKAPRADVDPLLAVAQGAALLCGKKLADAGEKLTDLEGAFVLPPSVNAQDVTPHHLGVLAKDKSSGSTQCCVIIDKDLPMDATGISAEKFFDTETASQQAVELKVVQGEPGAPPSRCVEIGTVPLQLGQQAEVSRRVAVVLSYDPSGRVHVATRDALDPSREASADLAVQGGGR